MVYRYQSDNCKLLLFSVPFSVCFDIEKKKHQPHRTLLFSVPAGKGSLCTGAQGENDILGCSVDLTSENNKELIKRNLKGGGEEEEQMNEWNRKPKDIFIN